jgi:uncharacterized membrane protein
MAEAIRVFKDIVLILSLFLVCAFFMDLVAVSEDGALVAIPLTVLIVYLWRKIDKKFFCKLA